MEYTTNTIGWACRSRSERIFPDGEQIGGFMWNTFKTIDHPFLQKLIDYNAMVTYFQGEVTVLGKDSMVLLHVNKDFVNIECISTPVEHRKQGSASYLMKAMIQAADETGTELRLRACNVTGHGPGWMIPDHIVVGHGAKKKGKIPTAKLKQWYEKLGFKTVGQVTGGKHKGVNMQYLPKKQWPSDDSIVDIAR